MSRLPSPQWYDLAKKLCGDKWDHFSPLNPSVDYVGPEGSYWSNLIPQAPFGVDFRPDAWIHDNLYRIGGTEDDRERADLVFSSMMLQSIQDHKFPRICPNWLGRWLARHAAGGYYDAVRLGGGGCFSFMP